MLAQSSTKEPRSRTILMLQLLASLVLVLLTRLTLRLLSKKMSLTLARHPMRSKAVAKWRRYQTKSAGPSPG